MSKFYQKERTTRLHVQSWQCSSPTIKETTTTKNEKNKIEKRSQLCKDTFPDKAVFEESSNWKTPNWKQYRALGQFIASWLDSLCQILRRHSRVTSLLCVNIFIAKVYTFFYKFWFLVPLGSKAARNDLQLVQQLHNDYNRNCIITQDGHLRYLSEDLILFSLFDSEVDSITKSEINTRLKKNEGE